MTPDQLRQTVLRERGDIAPETDLDHLQPNVGFPKQHDLDSMDFLNFIIALHEETQVDIPERDYPRLASLNGYVVYLAQKLVPTHQP